MKENTVGSPIFIYRCKNCLTLMNDRQIKEKGKCYKCGFNYVIGASPVSLLDYIKCCWWELTVR